MFDFEKRCNMCDKVKPLDEFHVARGRRDGHQAACKPCIRAYNFRRPRKESTIEKQRAWVASPEARARAFEWALERKYGITVERWHEMLIAQSGRCAACNDAFADAQKGVHVDHCHDTGRVRGLLCPACNRAEGFLRSDPVRVRGLLTYLENGGFVA